MSFVQGQRFTSMLFVIIAVIGLAGCSLGANGDEADSTPTPAPTGVTQVSGEDGTPPTERVEVSAPPPEGTPDSSLAPGTSSFDADGDGFMTAAELRAATNATMPEFAFPPEYQPTGDQIADQMLGPYPPSDPAAESYQIKMEYLLIGAHHECAWERVYLQANASSDAARQQEAIDALLAGLPKHPMDPGGREMFEDMYRKAQLGDPSGVANVVEQNCNGIGLLTPVAGT